MTNLDTEIQITERSLENIKKELVEWDENVRTSQKALSDELDRIEALQEFIEPEEVIEKLKDLQANVINANPPEQLRKDGEAIYKQLKYFNDKLIGLYVLRDKEIKEDIKITMAELEALSDEELEARLTDPAKNLIDGERIDEQDDCDS